MEKKRFTNYSTYQRTFIDSQGERQIRPFVIIEGNLTRDVELKSGKSTSYVFSSMGTSVSSEAVYAKAAGDYDKNASYDENPFFNLKFFGKTAERLAKIGKKGAKLSVWGDIEVEEYKDANGAVRKSITINVDNFTVLYMANGNGNGEDNGEKPAAAPPAAKKTKAKEVTPEPVDNLVPDGDDDDLPF